MKCVVVGSGPSGTNAALTLLQRGKAVELWDVGREEAAFPLPELGFQELKGAFEDPQAYLLGAAFEALLPPGSVELLRYPPSRRFLASAEDRWWPFANGRFRPFMSFARGGLGIGWGANAVSYDDDDLSDWPIDLADFTQAYRETCRRIPVAGTHDCLSKYFPGVTISQPAVRLNAHDQGLLSAFERRAAALDRRCRITLAVARLAVVNTAQDPLSCRYCGRCLWGCPHGSLYNPAQTTFEECRRYPNFTYRPGRLVLALEAGSGHIRGVRFLETETGQTAKEPCDVAFLAAGALQSGGIFLRSLQQDESLEGVRGELERTQSVMDTAVIKLPYIRVASVGSEDHAEQFQFNRLIIAHRKPRKGNWPVHAHGEVLSLNTLIYHPLVESIPLGTRRAIKLFAHFKSALGVVTYFFPDKQVSGNGISVVPDPTSPTGDRLQAHYGEAEGKAEYMDETLRDTRRALLRLGCLPWGAMRAPPGAGIHYAGTIPMGVGILCSDKSGRTNAYRNLYVCDGAAFPSLPSKSITLNLITHAIRVASLAEVQG